MKVQEGFPITIKFKKRLLQRSLLVQDLDFKKDGRFFIRVYDMNSI